MSQRPIDIAFNSHMSHERLARFVTRGQRWGMLIAACALVITGLAMSAVTLDYLWFARSGAALTALSVALASTALKHQRASTLAQAAWRLEEDGGESVADAEGLLASVQRQFLIMHLRLGAAGTLIWGFGDLLGYLFHG